MRLLQKMLNTKYKPICCPKNISLYQRMFHFTIQRLRGFWIAWIKEEIGSDPVKRIRFKESFAKRSEWSIVIILEPFCAPHVFQRLIWRQYKRILQLYEDQDRDKPKAQEAWIWKTESTAAEYLTQPQQLMDLSHIFAWCLLTQPFSCAFQIFSTWIENSLNHFSWKKLLLEKFCVFVAFQRVFATDSLLIKVTVWSTSELISFARLIFLCQISHWWEII